jgi:uncharacterized membrane protein YfcA
MYELLGYFSAVLIGVTLGLIGAGGSILTLPVLVYIIGINPVLATAYSLFIVGIAAFVGAVQNGFKGAIDYKTGFVFALPSFIAVYFTRRIILPVIPTEILNFPISYSRNFVLNKDMALMLFFAFVMLFAALSMLKEKKEHSGTTKKKINNPVVMIEGLFVGAITGLVGAGGGFLIIPALVLLAGLSMKKAIGTSLMIIAIKSLIGFIGDLSAGIQIEWNFLILFTLLSVLGIALGSYLSKFIEGGTLKNAFGFFMLIMVLLIVVKELF